MDAEDLQSLITRRKFLGSSLLAAASVAVYTPAYPASWPTRPIHLIVPTPAGGGTDLAGRLIGKALSEKLGQPVVVENRPGASGTIAEGVVARASADGYLLGIATTSTLPSSRVLLKNVTYDPVKDFTPISIIGTTPYVLLSAPSIPVGNLRDFVDYSRTTRAKLFYGSAGSSTLGYLVTRKLMKDFGIEMTHVPYKGSSEVYPALMSGEVTAFLDNPVTSAGLVASGRVKVLATTAVTPLMPHTETFSSQGYPQLTQVFWYGIVAPAEVPSSIVSQIQQVVADYARSEGGRQDLLRVGINALGSTPEQFQNTIAADTASIQKLANELGVSPQ